jgi:hypothetical protein
MHVCWLFSQPWTFTKCGAPKPRGLQYQIYDVVKENVLSEATVYSLYGDQTMQLSRSPCIDPRTIPYTVPLKASYGMK